MVVMQSVLMLMTELCSKRGLAISFKRKSKTVNYNFRNQSVAI